MVYAYFMPNYNVVGKDHYSELYNAWDIMHRCMCTVHKNMWDVIKFKTKYKIITDINFLKLCVI